MSVRNSYSRNSRMTLLAVVVAEPGGVEVELDRQVADDRHQLAALEDAVAGLAERRPELLRRHLVDLLEEPLEAARTSG